MGVPLGWGRHPATPVVVAALAAAVVAVVLKHAAFPLLSTDNDETINALFADALSRGRLFPSAGGAPDAFRPWLAAVSGDHYVLKYTPVVPALVAGSLVLTGGTGLYLAGLAAAEVVVTWLLAEEVLADRAEALVATALVALSPLVLVHSALLLPYLPTFVLLELFAWALLRGLGRGRPWLLGVSGAAIGLAFFVRSFDAVVFAAPLLVWAVTGARRRRLRGPAPAWFLAAAALPLAGFAAFNAAATGSPQHLTFSLLEPRDTVGFGARRLYPTDVLRHFGLAEGVDGSLRHGLLLGRWAAGGPILLALAVATLARRRIGGAAWPVLAAGALIPLAYVFFWGPWNATVLWGGTRYLGPFYFMAVLLPLALCGSRALVDLHRWRPAAAVAVGLGVLTLTAATAGPAIGANVRFTGHERALQRLVDGHSTRQLVFVRSATPFLMHPSPVVANRADLGGPVVYAVQQGDDDLDVARRLADRTPYRLRFAAELARPGEAVTGRLDQLRVVTGDRVELRVVTRVAAGSGRTALEVSAGGRTATYPVAPGAVSDRRLVVTAAGAAVEGPEGPPGAPRATAGTDLELRLLHWPDEVGAEAVVQATERLPLRAVGSSVELLVPTGPSWTTGPVAPALLDVTG